MRFRLVHELAAEGFPVAVTCRVLKVSTSGFYDWSRRGPSAKDVDDAVLLDQIIDIHAAARATYGYRRVHAELVLGRRQPVGRRRVARLMRLHRLAGVHRRRWRHHQRAEAVWPDHVQRQFHADRPDRLWVTDITQHPTDEGWVYLAAVLDVFSRRVVGWSIADHLRTELVVDALEMARWRRSPAGTIVHSDRGTQGGFNRSSQHLDGGGVWWDDRRRSCRRRRWVLDGSGPRIGRCVLRCVHRDGRCRRGMCSGASGG